MSLPVLEESNIPSELVGGVVLRIEPTATPSFTGGPIALALKLRAAATPCDPATRLRLFDTGLDTWVDAAKTCGEGSARYKSDFDTSTCTLVTHVCHLTDFAAFNSGLYVPITTTSNQLNAFVIAGGVIGALIGVVLIGLIVRHVYRQRQVLHNMVEAEKDTAGTAGSKLAVVGPCDGPDPGPQSESIMRDVSDSTAAAAAAAMARTKSGHVLQPMSILRRGMSQQSLEMMSVGSSAATTVSMGSGIDSNLAFVNEVEMGFDTDLEAGSGAGPGPAAAPFLIVVVLGISSGSEYPTNKMSKKESTSLMADSMEKNLHMLGYSDVCYSQSHV
jgi:hypothetical protein